MKESQRIKGVLAPVCTPFKADYSPDHNRFVAQCNWMLGQGSGLAVFGTNSEANSLSINERIALLDSLLAAGLDPARMMPGTGCCAFTDTVRLTRDQFVTRLRAADQRVSASTSGGGPVLYVHGYATSFGRGVSQAAEIAHRGRAPNPFVVFSWPAHKVFAVWPSVHALVSRAYRQDSASAAHSGSAFLDALTVVLSAAPSRSVTVLGHSMGAQIVAEALSAPSSVRDSLKAAPLYALVLFAADISAERFRDSLAAPLALIAERRVMYASASDRLLAISHLVNHGKRAGQVGAGGHPTDFEYVDVTNGRLSSGGVRGFIDPHHAMRYAGSALYDFFGVLRGLPADCRVTEGIADRAIDGSWRLTRAAIPDSTAKCSVLPHGN